MFTFNVGCSGNLELAIIMSVSIEDAAYGTIGSSLSYKYLTFKTQYKDTLGPILYIPTYINGKFYLVIDGYCVYNFTKITDVIITEGYSTIRQYAFANCPNLKSIQIPNSVDYIAEYAFQNSNQTIITFTSGNNNITMLYKGNNVKAIIYYRTSIINFMTEIPSLIYINDANNITFKNCQLINNYKLECVSYTVPSANVRPLAEIDNEITFEFIIDNSNDDKNVKFCKI